jgi:hydroxymethylbilane synthase
MTAGPVTLRLATRQSPLALVQTHRVAARLEALGIGVEIVALRTKGDRQASASLSTIGGEGVFVVEIQQAVLRGEADVAVHSAKDLPSTTLDGLTLGAIAERLDARDVLIGRSLAGLGPGATVATGSPRRRALLLERRPDLNIVDLRGNLATRVATIGRGGVDAIVAAAAALERMDQLPLVAEYLNPEWFIPQVGQGALALECRSDDVLSLEVLTALHLPDVGAAVFAERAFLRELGTGCALPVAAWAQSTTAGITLSAAMIASDGSASVREVHHGVDPIDLGSAVARRLRDDRGGAAFLS